MPISIYGVNNPDLLQFKPDANATLWRYMDIGKYFDMITRGSLWFARVSEFRKADPYEGALTTRDQERTLDLLSAKTKDELRATLLRYGELGIHDLMDKVTDKSHHFFQLIILSRLPHVEMNIYTHSISCWHENQSESDAMWELYAKRNAGIAIKSSVPRILDAFGSSKRTIAIAKVNYDSTSRLSALTSGVFDSILIKRHAFSHEREVRLIALTMDGYEAPGWTEDNQTYQVDPVRPVPSGFYIDCDIQSLTEEIVISPSMEPYAYEAIEKISKTLLPNTPIRKSTLFTREDMPLMMSAELSVMWAEYRRTRLLRDISEIRGPAKGDGPAT